VNTNSALELADSIYFVTTRHSQTELIITSNLKSTILRSGSSHIQSFDQGVEIKGMNNQKTNQSCVSKTI
jgi:hypothetical protein